MVAIESPLAAPTDAGVAENKAFARKASAFASEQGFAPFAMHLLFTQFLDDNDKSERNIGIGCGLAWSAHASAVWFCLREGESMTSGMLKALDAENARKGTSAERPSDTFASRATAHTYATTEASTVPVSVNAR